jgi:hypothetical protein
VKGRAGVLKRRPGPATSQRGTRMELTQEHLHILHRAFLLSLDGCGQVLKPEAYPEADDLAEQGWLERRFEENGDLSWWWTPQAETALNYGSLMNAAEGREN